ncbi:MAG TPA: glycosyl hydrolase, partial [Nitrolancea sp.]|nr:glycosyl hydrolase [Nitrolancea sp.]
KSTDGGKSWQNVGLAATRHISGIAVHPQNPDIVYVGALGHAWGPNEERGVYRSTDGGKNWQKVLYKSPKAGVAQLSMDPNNPRVLFATLWQGQRYPYALHSGGDDSGIWRSTDGGDTWQDITRNPGLPQKAMLGRMGISVSPARSGRVWAVIEADQGQGGFYRSDDNGDTWQLMTDQSDLRRRPWYYQYVMADPVDPDTVYVCNLQFWKSSDGGKTFEAIPTAHGDNHALWIDPQDNKRMIEGNDGGAVVTYNGGVSWSTLDNQPTAQFYHVAVDDQVPYHIYGSQQDNYAMRLPSLGREGAISKNYWTEPGGGESGYIAISPKPPHQVFGGGIGTGLGHGRLLAWNPETGQKRNVTVWPEVVTGLGSTTGANALKYRFQWTFPVEFSPHDPDVLYVTSNHVHRSRDEGHSWEVISPDLTHNNPQWLEASGGPITADNSGAEIYCTIFAFRESPSERGVLWAGSDDGLIHVSRDNGQSWQNVTPPQNLMPQWSQILIIEPCAHHNGEVYVAATRYKFDDPSPFLFKTSDYGQTWTSINGNLPKECITRVVREDPEVEGLLYLGTETGLYVSLDGGQSWQPFQANLPVTPIYDLAVKDGDLVAATHGRSFWILDDLSPVRELAGMKGGFGEQTHLFTPGYAVRYRTYGRGYGRKRPDMVSYMATGPISIGYWDKQTPMGTSSPDFLDAGKNPPNGAVVHYYLNQAPGEDEEITLTFLDHDGQEIRSYSSKAEEPPRVPAAQGMNRFLWDLRTQPPVKLDVDPIADPFQRMMQQNVAPRVLPGNYQVQLKAGGQTLTRAFTVSVDPKLINMSPADLTAQHDLKRQIVGSINEINQALNQINKVRGQVAHWEDRVKGTSQEQQLAEPAKQLKDKLSDIESRLIVANPGQPKSPPSQLRERLFSLASMIDESDDKPTQGAQEVYQVLSQQVQEQMQQLQQVMQQEVPQFSQKVQQANVAPVGP